jgi:hypothetical protein
MIFEESNVRSIEGPLGGNRDKVGRNSPDQPSGVQNVYEEVRGELK